jgi:hypothetical protein
MGAAVRYGTVCPAFAFTCLVSDAVMVPLTFVSVRKLSALMAKPEVAFVCPMSLVLTDLFPSTSPSRKLMSRPVRHRISERADNGMGAANSSAAAFHPGIACEG